MHWIFISLSAPFLWSILNHLDKYLISKYVGNSGVGGLSIFSSGFAVFTLPILYFFDKNIFNINILNITILSLTGVLTALGILFYLYALNNDEASYVVPFWFLIPIFSYVLGVFILGEHIFFGKIIGSIITIIGAFVLSLKYGKGFHVRTGTVTLMIASSFVLALNNVLFKDLAIHTSFWQSMFWNQFGLFIFGLSAFLFIKKYRQDFIKIVKFNTLDLTLFNIGGEIVQVVAGFFNYYAVILAQVSLVLLIEYTFQPLFVLLGGIILTKLFPYITKEETGHKYTLQKFFAISIMAVGVYLIVI